jgi:hypothetical protein
MQRKLAVKRLKPSDLSLFHAYLVKHPQVRQKSFNLDRKVFEDVFFPAIQAEIDSTPENRAPVALTFFGPGGAAGHLLMRKILKQEKNWRLNGEAVYNPDDQPGRYDEVAPEDLALMEFTGAGLPEGVKVVLLSATHPADSAIHAAVSVAFPGGGMSVIEATRLEELVLAANPPPDHPVRDWLDRDLYEEVGRGGEAAVEQLDRRRGGRGMSNAELKRAKQAAERIGEIGEELLDRFLRAEGGRFCAQHEWVARRNAISPFDFNLEMTDGSRRHADAKSTAGAFSNPIHLSMGEIRHALSSDVPYDIFRLYNIHDGACFIRVARDIATSLVPVMKILETLPATALVDSISFDPEHFDFGPEIPWLDHDDDDDEGE